MKHYLLILAILLGSVSMYAGQPVIDSLQALLVTEKDEKVQLKILNKIAFNYYRMDPNKTVTMSLENIELAKRIGDEEGRLSALNNLAIGQVFQNESQKALETFQLLEEEGKKSGFMTIVHRACNNKGNLFADLGQEEKAINAFHQAVAIAKMEEDDNAYCIYINNLVSALMNQGEFKKAERYYKNALPVARKLSDQSVLSSILHGYGNLKEQMDETEQGLKFYQESLKLSRKNGDKQSLISTLNSMSALSLAKGEERKALKYTKEALTLAKQMGSSRVLTQAYLTIAQTYLSLGDFEKAIDYSQRGLADAAKAQNITIQGQFYELLAEAYSEIEDFQMALENHKTFKSIQDSLAQINQAQKVKEVSLKYDMAAKEEENVELRKEQQQQNTAIKLRNLIGLLVGIALLLVSVITLMLYRNNQRKFRYNQQLEKEVELSTSDLKSSNEELQRSNKELERFAHIASHDLKEPLRNITSFVRLIERRLEGKNEHLKEYLQFVQNNAKQMHILIEDVLEYSKLGEQQPVLESVDVEQTMKQVSMGMQQFLHKRNATVNIGDLPEIKSSNSQLYLLFKNVIENGVIFNDQQAPEVNISYECAESFHLFKIVDNGIGIEEKYQKKIFGMFHRLHDRVKHHGSGLGLSICKKIVNRLGGEIWVESEIGKGSTFYIELPMDPNKTKKGKLTVSVIKSEIEKEVELAR